MAPMNLLVWAVWGAVVVPLLFSPDAATALRSLLVVVKQELPKNDSWIVDRVLDFKYIDFQQDEDSVGAAFVSPTPRPDMWRFSMTRQWESSTVSSSRLEVETAETETVAARGVTRMTEWFRTFNIRNCEECEVSVALDRTVNCDINGPPACQFIGLSVHPKSSTASEEKPQEDVSRWDSEHWSNVLSFLKDHTFYFPECLRLWEIRQIIESEFWFLEVKGFIDNPFYSVPFGWDTKLTKAALEKHDPLPTGFSGEDDTVAWAALENARLRLSISELDTSPHDGELEVDKSDTETLILAFDFDKQPSVLKEDTFSKVRADTKLSWYGKKFKSKVEDEKQFTNAVTTCVATLVTMLYSKPYETPEDKIKCYMFEERESPENPESPWRFFWAASPTQSGRHLGYDLYRGKKVEIWYYVTNDHVSEKGTKDTHLAKKRNKHHHKPRKPKSMLQKKHRVRHRVRRHG